MAAVDGITTSACLMLVDQSPQQGGGTQDLDFTSKHLWILVSLPRCILAMPPVGGYGLKAPGMDVFFIFYYRVQDRNQDRV
jgi:hypothetical protein